MEPIRINRRPTDPGAILKSMFLVPRNVSQKAFADSIGTTEKYVSQLVHGTARIDKKIAARIAKVLDTTPALWLNLQAGVDAFDAEKETKAWKPRAVYGPECVSAL